MDRQNETVVNRHAKSLLDLANQQTDEITATDFLSERLAAWGAQVPKEHFQAVSRQLEKLSGNKNDKLPTVEIVDSEGTNKAIVTVKDYSAKTTAQLAARAVDKFISDKDEGVFSNMKDKLSNEDYEDFLCDSNRILKQITTNRLELNLADGSDADDRADQVYGVVQKASESKKSDGAPNTDSGVAKQEKLDALGSMPAAMANSETGANIAWESFFEKR